MRKSGTFAIRVRFYAEPQSDSRADKASDVLVPSFGAIPRAFSRCAAINDATIDVPNSAMITSSDYHGVIATQWCTSIFTPMKIRIALRP